MAHTLDTHQVNNGLSGNPSSFNYTCGTGATVLVLSLVVAASVARAGGAPTYNGAAMTQVDQLRTATETNVEMWYLLDPPTGAAYAVSIPNTGGKTIHAHTCSAKAAAGKTSALDQQIGSTGTTANPSLTRTTTVNGDFLYSRCGHGYLSLGTGNKTQFGDAVWGSDHGAYTSMRMYELQAALGSSSHTLTVSADDWCMILVAFKEVSPPILLEGTASCGATGAAAITTEIRMAGAAATSATAAADLTVAQQALLAGTATCGATGAAALSTEITLAGEGAGGATAAAALTTDIRMAGTATCAASASAPLTTQIALAGTASCGVPSATATFSTEILLAGQAACGATATAALTTANNILLEGAASCGATAAAALFTEIRMAGAASCAATASAPLTTEITLSGAAACTLFTAADLSVGPQGAALAGLAACGLAAQAALLTQILLSGQGAGSLTAAALLAGSGQLSVPITRVEIRGFKYL